MPPPPLPARGRRMPGGGVLASVLESECRQILPPPGGPGLSWSGLLLAILCSFAFGCCCAVGLLGAAGWGAWAWWSRPVARQRALTPPPPVGQGRLEGYKAR